jgi:hypothetical protein
VSKERLKDGSEEINTDTRYAGKEQERKERKYIQAPVATSLNKEFSVSYSITQPVPDLL